MKVDFMIIGAQKCGTTSLFDTLTQHPSVIGCRNKEPHFFSLSPDWRRDLPLYDQLFETREGAIYGEASTSYTFYPRRNKRIWDDLHDYNPKLKLIYLVRRPIDRVISNYMHAFERGYTDEPIEKLIVEERSYVDVSRYYTQIMPYIRRFGREQVHLIDFDDLTRERKTVIEGLARFLEIDPAGLPAEKAVHSNASVNGSKLHHKFDQPALHHRLIRRVSPQLWRRLTDNSDRRFSRKPPVSVETQQILINMLELEVRALEPLLGKDLSHWLTTKDERANMSGAAAPSMLATS